MSWVYMVVYGCLWVSTGFYECLWMFMEILLGFYGCSRISMRVYRFSGVYGYL